jgi:hypothetical protein
MLLLMRLAILAVVVLFARSAPGAPDTAYSALRVVGKKNGAELLERVVEVRGRSGAPQPEVWRIVIDDPGARGGVRELEVQRGRVIAERTPTARPLGRPMNFNQLNLDSEGVFTIVNQEAQKAGVPFDRVDYLLKSGTGSGAPVWQVQLFNGSGGSVGALQIAADSGAVLRQEGFTARGRTYSREEDQRYLEERGDVEVHEQPGYERRDSGMPGFFKRVERHFQRRGRQIENFFTGRGVSERD